MSCIKIRNDRDCNIIIEDSLEEGFVQVYILKFINQESNQIVIKETPDLEVKFKYKGDGQYTICKITISSDTTLSNHFDTESKKFYILYNEASLKQIVDLRDILKEYIYYFSTCLLRKCFINICQEIFKSLTSICNKPSTDGSLTYKRDLLWSALNVIEYLIDMCQIEEALRLLDEITNCNGLCPKSNIINNGCGCGS